VIDAGHAVQAVLALRHEKFREGRMARLTQVPPEEVVRGCRPS